MRRSRPTLCYASLGLRQKRREMRTFPRIQMAMAKGRCEIILAQEEAKRKKTRRKAFLSKFLLLKPFLPGNHKQDVKKKQKRRG